MRLDLNTWIISDTHFGHNRIIELAGRPQNHDELMLKNWAASVKPDDFVLHLGDLGLRHGKPPHLSRAVEALPGRKFMIWGNHDDNSEAYYNSLGFTMIDDFAATMFMELESTNEHMYGGNSYREIVFSHYPRVDAEFDWDINIHGHIHTSGWPPEASLARDYRNVSIEHMSYMPVRLYDILFGRQYQARTQQIIPNEYEITRHKNDVPYDLYRFLDNRESWRKAKIVH